jgi:RNA polymerase-interacting CarD/CdnL/TRCF family regulator
MLPDPSNAAKHTQYVFQPRKVHLPQTLAPKKKVMEKKVTEGDLLYHSVHGLCRVSQINKRKESGKEAIYYELVPHATNHMKLRFVIAESEIEGTGFHAPVSVKEANAILEYLKNGSVSIPSAIGVKPRSFAEDNQTWALAKTILSCSRNEAEAKEQRKRQTLERTARGLIRELAFALQISITEAAARVKKNLEKTTKLSPLVSTALENAVQD